VVMMKKTNVNNYLVRWVLIMYGMYW
jgi:hypothetical protein